MNIWCTRLSMRMPQHVLYVCRDVPLEHDKGRCCSLGLCAAEMLQLMGQNAALYTAARNAMPVWRVLFVCHIPLVQAPKPRHARTAQKNFTTETLQIVHACTCMCVSVLPVVMLIPLSNSAVLPILSVSSQSSLSVIGLEPCYCDTVQTSKQFRNHSL